MRKTRATDNIYDVMVEATDETGHVGRKAVKVEVTNVNEDGTGGVVGVAAGARRCFHRYPYRY